MKTVKQICTLTGVSSRTLRHYHAIGLLIPSHITEAGYRMYDSAAVDRLRMILAFREIGFSLKDIQHLLDATDEERSLALERHTGLLQAQVDRLQNRIHFANGIKQTGVEHMDWNNFNAGKPDALSNQAEALYGKTEAYREYKTKSKDRTPTQETDLGTQVMDFFFRLGSMRHLPPESEEAQVWAKELQTFLTAHYYTCTKQIFRSLGQMYAAGGSMTENIDAAGGKGTAEFANKVIEIYCRKK